MPEPLPVHPAALSLDDLDRQCRVERGRASGPGGQRRNKVETAVRLLHEPTGIVVTASERRSQAQNLNVARFRLRNKLALEVRTPVPASRAAPSALWRSRTAAGRIACNRWHEDFPALLAEALDAVAHCGYGHARAADVLGITPTQLIRFLRSEPAALAQLNEKRAEIGQHPLRG